MYLITEFPVRAVFVSSIEIIVTRQSNEIEIKVNDGTGYSSSLSVYVLSKLTYKPKINTTNPRVRRKKIKAINQVNNREEYGKY